MGQLSLVMVTERLFGNCVQMMLDFSDAKNSGLSKGPCTQLLCKVSVGCSDGFAFGQFDLCIEPLVFQCFDRTQHCKPSRIPCLHRGDKGNLLPCREWLFNGITLFLWIISVSGALSANYWRKEWARTTKHLRHPSWEGDGTFTAKEILKIWSKSQWLGHEKNIMPIFC